MSYDFNKNTCDRCGITKEEAKKFPVDTGINHPEHRYSTSFRLDYNGGALCARCHKEHEIESVLAALDKAAKKDK